MDYDVIRKPIDISRELEAINFKELALKHSHSKRKKDELFTISTKRKVKQWAWKRKNVQGSQETKASKNPNKPQTQLAAFREAMKLLLIIGQSLGLNPVRGILVPDVSEMRLTVFSWRFLYCLLIGLSQAVATILCLYRLQQESLSIGTLAYICFYGTTCATTFLFIQIGYRWSKLLKEISESCLDEYTDPRLKFRCNIVSIGIITLAVAEHLLSITHKVIELLKCHPDINNYYEYYLSQEFPWVFQVNVPRNISIVPLGVFLQILNLWSTLNWNYSDLFIVCISMYLASILNKLNEKIISAGENKYLPPSEWKLLREDYTKATRLVRSFDETFSGIIFCSFAANLFFICLQLFNILAFGVNSAQILAKEYCPNLFTGWILAGQEYTIYLIFSVAYLFVRTLAVSLVTASVNTASLVPAPALYSVPASAFCEEVARFIEQVHANTVALSGLQFFFVTRDLVLHMAGTIVTYELVLLQFYNI